MHDDRTLLSLDASLAIPTRVLRFEDSGLRRRTPVRPVPVGVLDWQPTKGSTRSR
jgi:hypothetical protein